MKKNSFLLFLFLSTFTFSQKEENEIQEKKYTPSQLKSDFEILVKTLEEVHHSLHRYVSKDSLSGITDSTLNSFTSDKNDMESYLTMARYVKHVACGHTATLPSKEWIKSSNLKSKLLPLGVYLVDDRIYVRKAYRGDSILIPGTEILSINNLSISDILKNINSIVWRDGTTMSFVNHNIQVGFNTHFLLLYGGFYQFEITYKLVGQEAQSIILEGGIPENKVSVIAPAKVEEDTKYLTQLKSSTAHYYIQKDQPEIAVIDIDMFPSRGYKKLYKSAFKDINEKKIEHLVLDLRKCVGGRVQNGNNLLTYLIAHDFEMKFHRPDTKPKKHKYLKLDGFSKLGKFVFNRQQDRDKSDPDQNFSLRYKPQKKNLYLGKLYVLTDGGSFSLGAMAPTQLKNNREAVFIGTETGGAEIGSGGMVLYELILPNTGIRVMVPYYFVGNEAAPGEYGQGLIPDIIVKRDIQDILSGEDLEMKEVIRLVKGSGQ